MELGFWTFILLLLNGILYFLLFSRRKRRRGEPPQVYHKVPIIGGTLQFGKQPLEYIRRLKKIYGDVFTMLLAGWEVHFFTNPSDVKYLEKAKQLKHDVVLYDFATRVVGCPHAIDVNGDQNPRGPEVMQTISKTMRGSSSLSKLTETCLISSTFAFENSIRYDPRFINKKPIPLYELAGEIMFDITFNMFFGYLTSKEDREAEKKMLYDDFMYYFDKSALLVDRVSINLLPKVKKTRERLLKKLSSIDLDNRVGVSDLIRSVTNISKAEEHEGERARHLLILLWSAQANSRPAVFWAMFYLLRHPEVANCIMQEYDQVMGKKMNTEKKEDSRCEKSEENQPDDSSILSHWLGISEILMLERKDLDKMVILDSSVKESLRLAGSSMSIRHVMKDTSIRVASGQKYKMRKGDYSAVFSTVTHMNEDIHERPHEYIYDRFLVKHDEHRGDEDNSDIGQTHESRRSETEPSDSSTECETPKSVGHFKARTRFGKPGKQISATRALLTFGYGINRCPGRHIALIEIKLCVLLFFRYFNVSLLNKDEKLPAPNMRHLGFGVMPPLTDVNVLISEKRSDK